MDPTGIAEVVKAFYKPPCPRDALLGQAQKLENDGQIESTLSGVKKISETKEIRSRFSEDNQDMPISDLKKLTDANQIRSRLFEDNEDMPTSDLKRDRFSEDQDMLIKPSDTFSALTNDNESVLKGKFDEIEASDFENSLLEEI